MKITQKEAENLSAEELKDLMEVLKKALGKKREDEYAKAREKIDEIASSVGLSANDLLEKTEKPAPKPRKEDYYP